MSLILFLQNNLLITKIKEVKSYLRKQLSYFFKENKEVKVLSFGLIKVCLKSLK